MKSTIKHLLGLPILATVLTLTGCSTTRFTHTWTAPDATLKHIQSGSKVGALVIYPSASVERSAEEALAAALTQRGMVGVPAYTLLGDANPTNEKVAKAAFEKSGAVAVVVLTGVEVRNQEVFSAPTVAGPFENPTKSAFWNGYYSYNWNAMADPGYLKTAKLVSVETMVYDLKSNKLVWSGRSQTVEPGKLDAFIQEIVDEAASRMKKDGVI